jgi:hypothetical protein
LVFGGRLSAAATAGGGHQRGSGQEND